MHARAGKAAKLIFHGALCAFVGSGPAAENRGTRHKHKKGKNNARTRKRQSVPEHGRIIEMQQGRMLGAFLANAATVLWAKTQSGGVLR